MTISWIWLTKEAAKSSKRRLGPGGCQDLPQLENPKILQSFGMRC